MTEKERKMILEALDESIEQNAYAHLAVDEYAMLGLGRYIKEAGLKKIDKEDVVDFLLCIVLNFQKDIYGLDADGEARKELTKRFKKKIDRTVYDTTRTIMVCERVMEGYKKPKKKSA